MHRGQWSITPLAHNQQPRCTCTYTHTFGETETTSHYTKGNIQLNPLYSVHHYGTAEHSQTGWSHGWAKLIVNQFQTAWFSMLTRACTHSLTHTEIHFQHIGLVPTHHSSTNLLRHLALDYPFTHCPRPCTSWHMSKWRAELKKKLAVNAYRFQTGSDQFAVWTPVYVTHLVKL